MDRLDEVQDPSDFPVDTLRKLDGSLRCPICRELFDGPVILHCGHTFCSLCVRNLLPAKPECPKCRAPAKELHLVRNATFEEAVTAWSDARTYTLRLAKESVRSSPSAPVNVSRGIKRKLPHEASNAEAGPSRLVWRGNDRNFSVPLEQEEGGDEEYHSASGEDEPDKMVACPLCGREVTYDRINQHIDSACKKFVVDDVESDLKSKVSWNFIFDGQGKKAATTTSNGTRDSAIPVKKLAKVSYGTIKNHDLRKLLGDNGLPTTGERHELIQRHQRWVAINNANLDRGQPKPVRDLKRQLKEMEDVASKSGPKKVQDEKEYIRKHSAHFASLIEKARPVAKNVEERISAVESPAPPRTTRTMPPSSAPASSDIIEID